MNCYKRLVFFFLNVILEIHAYHRNECYEFVGCPDKVEAIQTGVQFLDWKGRAVSQLHTRQPDFDADDNRWKIQNNFPMEFKVGIDDIQESLAMVIQIDRPAHKPANPTLTQTAEQTVSARYHLIITYYLTNCQ